MDTSGPLPMEAPSYMDKFSQDYHRDIEQIPPEYRERAAKLIDLKVEQRVQEHMSVLWKEVQQELQNQNMLCGRMIVGPLYRPLHTRSVLRPLVRSLSPQLGLRAPMGFKEN